MHSDLKLITTLLVLAILSGIGIATLEDYAFNTQKSERVSQLTRDLASARSRLEYLVNSDLDRIRGVVSYVAINPEITQAELEAYAHHHVPQQSNFINIALAKNLIITHIYPVKGNEKTLGLSYLDTPSQKDSVIKAINLKETVIAGPLNLVQGGKGIIGRIPIFLDDQTLWGIASIVIDIDAIFTSAGLLDHQNLTFTVKGKDGLGEQGDVIWGNPQDFNTNLQQTISLPYGSWRISGKDRHPPQWQPTPLIWIGVLSVTFILGAWFFQRSKSQQLKHKLLEQEFKAQQHFRIMFQGHNAIMILLERQTGKIVDANISAQQFYGYSHQQITNMHVYDFSHLSREAIKKKLMDGVSETGDVDVYPHELASGELRYVEVHASPFRINDKKLLFAVIHDITEKKRIEQQLKHHAIVFEYAQEGIFITDDKLQVLSVNKSYVTITGFSEEESIGERPLKSPIKENLPFRKKVNDEILQKGFWRGELINYTKNGTRYPIMLSVSAVKDDQGNATHYVGVFSDIRHLKQTEERLFQLAHFDHLTQLPNRLALQVELTQALKRIDRVNNILALMFIDLDQFKEVNDSLGHAYGDEILQLVAKRLRNTIREKDIIARLGGDEFVVLIEDFQEDANPAIIAKKIIDALNLPFYLDNNMEIHIGGSIGIALSPDNSDDSIQLMGQADKAMYHAKQNGRNKFVFFSDISAELPSTDITLYSQIRLALKNNEFELFYQPQIYLHNQQIYGVEALIRWHHPQRGTLSPIHFIPFAEKRGIMRDISRWVVDQAIQQIQRWQQQGISTKISINLTASDFNRHATVDYILDALKTTGIDPTQLVIELTESTLMQHLRWAQQGLQQLKALGVWLSIDDFGVEYASFAYLKNFPANCLKIDKSFTRDIAKDPLDQNLVRAIIAMSKTLGMQVIAEGVETREQEEILLKEGCDISQGYYYSHPKPIGEIEPFIIEHISKY